MRGGATQVQGTINGYGERTGNCNLTTIIPNLTLKMGVETIPRDRLERLTPVATTSPSSSTCRCNPQAPYVGHSAFAHKAGLHTSAIAKRPDAYEHVEPEVVGNGTRFVVSELAGSSTLVMKAKELGLELDGPQLAEVVEQLKQLEHEGYHFEAADGSLELLMRRIAVSASTVAGFKARIQGPNTSKVTTCSDRNQPEVHLRSTMLRYGASWRNRSSPD